MRFFVIFLAALYSISIEKCYAEDVALRSPTKSNPPESDADLQGDELMRSFRGWDYLVKKLRKEGIGEYEIRDIYQDKRMPYFSEVTFKLKPKEAKSSYSAFYDETRLKKGGKFLHENEQVLAAAEEQFEVSRFVITSILLIETQLGKVTGSHLVLNRISRLASIAAPDNLDSNFERQKKQDPSTTREQTNARGQYLEDMFFPEVPALFKISRQNELDLFDLKGSRAGAFGIPQFLPSTYLSYAVDADKDGVVSLFNTADAIYSTANFLKRFGWKDDLPREQKAKVIWRYNHSDVYVETILGVAHKLQQRQRPSSR